jgi:hypothetical protein
LFIGLDKGLFIVVYVAIFFSKGYYPLFAGLRRFFCGVFEDTKAAIQNSLQQQQQQQQQQVRRITYNVRRITYKSAAAATTAAAAAAGT